MGARGAAGRCPDVMAEAGEPGSAPRSARRSTTSRRPAGRPRSARSSTAIVVDVRDDRRDGPDRRSRPWSRPLDARGPRPGERLRVRLAEADPEAAPGASSPGPRALAALPGHPEDVAAGVAVGGPREDEEQVGEPVEVGEGLRRRPPRRRRAPRRSARRAGRPCGRGAGPRRRGSPPGSTKLVRSGSSSLTSSHQRSRRSTWAVGDAQPRLAPVAAGGHAEVGAEVEEVVLDRREPGVRGRRRRPCARADADQRR